MSKYTYKSIYCPNNPYDNNSFNTHRRSVVKRGGHFQRRLFACQLFVCQFVSQFVCPHDNFRTIKRRMMKLGRQVHCTKISPEFEFGGQRLKYVNVTGDKKTKN